MIGVFGGVLYGAKEIVAPFVGKRIPHLGPTGFHPLVNVEALGVVREEGLIGGAVYHGLADHGPDRRDIQVSIAFEDPRWMRRGILAQLFAYPFLTVECARMTALVAEDADRARKLLEGLGFVHEGTHPRGYDGERAATSYGLLREDCRWLRG